MTNNSIAVFLELCDPRRDYLTASTSDISWENISELSKLHGVTPFLFYRTRQLGIPVPEEIKREWLGYYLYQLAEDQKARRQIKELKELLDRPGVPFILLKGASAVLRLYPEPGLRTFADLDILIPVDKVDRFKRAIVEGGYRFLYVRNSTEDEELRKLDVHLVPVWKDGTLMVQAHLNILGVRGNHLIATPEIWQEKEAKSTGGINLQHLSVEHFVIHNLVHCSKHFSDEGFIEIKWLVDLLQAEKAWAVGWSKVIDIACKWGVEKDIYSLLATLNYYWHAGIPLPGAPEPLALNILVSGIQDQQKRYYAKLPASYIERLLEVRELPNVASQFRYVLHLFFPTRENLRWRYGFLSQWSMIPYYLVHLFFTFRKFSTGLWYHLLYNSQKRPKRIQ